MASSNCVKQPEVVKFAYNDFVVDIDGNKWKAKCCKCKDTITETRGTTTGFTRFVRLILYFVINS